MNGNPLMESAPAKRNEVHPRDRDGFILITVLWILLMLATLTTIYAVYLSNSALALAANDIDVEKNMLVSAGLELTAYHLAVAEKAQKDARPTHGQFRIRLGGANLAVSFVSEAARVDLNEAEKPLLAGLFTVLGAGQNAESYADRVIGWRTEPKDGTQDSEANLYRAAGLPYSPRGGPFAHVNELWLLQGMPPALIERALPFVTIYSGRPAVNILDAAPQVLAALPGMTDDRLDALLNRRENLTLAPRNAADLLGTENAAATTEGSDAFRVNVRVRFDDSRNTHSEAVILMGSEDVPYHVLSWQDEDGATVAPVRNGGAR
jgi:general secretion pathway protein K